jgi:hypothetical protein
LEHQTDAPLGARHAGQNARIGVPFLLHNLLNVIGKAGLLELLDGVSSDVQREALDWYRVAKAAEWASFSEVRLRFPDANR